MLQQNDNGVALTWLKRTLFKWDSPVHTLHQLPSCKIFPFSIHTPHGNKSETGAITGTRGSCEYLGATVGIDQSERCQSGSRHCCQGHSRMLLCMRAIQQTEFFSPPSPQPYRVKLLMEKERKLSLMSDWHSCQRSHRIFNN